MAGSEPDLPVSGCAWLRERAPTAHIEEAESIQHVLGNRAVGVEREGAGDALTLQPGEGYGALAVATDRRLLILVGNCREREGDVAMPIPYEVITRAGAETEALTRRLVVSTESDVDWAITAREPARPATVAEFLTDASDAWRAAQAYFETAQAARAELETAVADDEQCACERAIRAAREAIAPIEAALADVTLPLLESRVDELAAEIDELATASHRREAEDLATAAETALENYEYEAAYEHLRRAEDHLARIDGLGVDPAAAPVTDGGAAVGSIRDRVQEMREGLGTRPVTDAEALRERAADAEAVGDRITALEEALVCYRNAAGLVERPETPFESDEVPARRDAEAVIAELVDAHNAAASRDRSAAEWEQEVGNHRSAYDLYIEARDHLERALELAESYPPGDAASIRSDMAAIEDTLDPLEITVRLADQTESGQDG